MTTLTSSHVLVDGLSPRLPATERRDGLRSLLRRLAAIAQLDTSRRTLAGLPPHLRRDIGLGDIDVLDL